MVSISIVRKSISFFRRYRTSALKNGTILLCFFLPLALSSQNLIKNPSFEQYVNCPERLGNFDADVVSWSTPTMGSTDYFNACSTTMGTPTNFNGEQAADFGKGYAGFYLYAPDDYREYLQAELTLPLEKGKEYRISFFVSLAESSDFAINEFGVLFAKNKMDIPLKKELSKGHWYRQKGNAYTYLEIGYTNLLSDTQDWIPVSTRFTANGTERFMIIGNFDNNARTRKLETKRNAKQGAYYYVDMVEVKATDKHPVTVVKGGKENFVLNTVHVFENILFGFDHFEILETGRGELQGIFDYLKARPNLSITINGHSDSVGTESYNRVLSGKRAEAVAEYLQKLGIPKKRITWQGHGDAIPVASNETEDGRKRNRRVEFVISEP